MPVSSQRTKSSLDRVAGIDHKVAVTIDDIEWRGLRLGHRRTRVHGPSGRARGGVGAVFLTSVLLWHSLAAAEQTNVWEITESGLNGISAPSIAFRNSAGQTVDQLPAEYVRTLKRVYDRIGSTTGFSGARLIINGESGPNAAAGRGKDGTPVVVFSMGMMKLTAGDPDMVAAVMAHEFGHQVLGHRGYAATSAAIDVASNLLALLIGRSGASDAAKAIGAIGGTLAIQSGFRSFDRDREREADRFGIEHMIRAGYSAEGAARIWSDPRMQGGGWLSTHPSSSERLANVRELGVQFAHLGQPPPVRTANPNHESAPPTVTDVALKDDVERDRSTIQPAAPTLLQRVQCRLPDSTVVANTRIGCARQGGVPDQD